MTSIDTGPGMPPSGTKEKLVANATPGLAAFVKPIAASVLRHAATAAGVYLVSKGVTDSNGASQFVGAVMTIGGLGWSWYEKYGSAMIKQALSDSVDILHQRAAQARAATSKPSVAGTSDRQKSTGG